MSSNRLKEKLAANLRRNLIPDLCQDLSSIFNISFADSNFTELAEVDSMMKRARQGKLIYSSTIDESKLKNLTKRILKYGDTSLEDYVYLQLPHFMDVGLVIIKLGSIIEHLAELLNKYEMLVLYTPTKSYGFLFNLDGDGIEIEIWGEQWESIIDR